MPYKDLHAKPFDETTQTKLSIFKEYAKLWLPTFVMSGNKKIFIVDFFAGTGRDITGKEGSPLGILEAVKLQKNNILNKQNKIFICFNEYDKNKFELLKSNCEKYIATENLSVLCDNDLLDIIYKNEDFETLFPEMLDMINDLPSLVYLDQNGIKYLNDDYFMPLVNSRQTDFLYFVSSSYIKRFKRTEQFKNSLSFDLAEVGDVYKYVHQQVIEKLREKIPIGSKTRLYPFTLKKENNYYGIIFGASHPRAVDKFLAVAWSENKINGSANFDIDDDESKVLQEDLFEGKQLTKIEKFQYSLEKEILNKHLRTNKDVYDYTLEHGHIPAHSREVLNRLKKDKKIKKFERSLLIGYEYVYKNNNIITFEVI